MEPPYDPIPIRNYSGEEIPSFGVVQPTNETPDGAVAVVRPTANGQRAVLVNGEGAVPAGGGGDAYAAPRVRVRVAAEPTILAEYGATAGGWELTARDGGGFFYIGRFAGGVGEFLRAAGSPAAANDCLRKFRSLRPTDCVAVEVTAGTGLCAGGGDQSFDAAWSDGASGWVGEEYVYTPLGLGLFTFYRAADRQPAAKLTVGGTDYRGTFAGCASDDGFRFLFGDEEMCPDSGSGVEACGDHVIEIVVRCASCEIQVCDDPDYTMPRRLCFLAEDLVIPDTWNPPGPPYGAALTLEPFAAGLTYRNPAFNLFSGLGAGPAGDHWWFGSVQAGIASTTGAWDIGLSPTTGVFVLLVKDAGDCTGYQLSVIVPGLLNGNDGNPYGGPHLFWGYVYHTYDFSGGPPNPLDLNVAPVTFAANYTAEDGALSADDITAAGFGLLAGDCPGGTGGGEGGGGGGGATPCCMGAGESLESHPDIEFVVPDGDDAGTYTAVWDAGDERYEFTTATAIAVAVACTTFFGSTVFQMTIVGGSGYATSVSCDPFGLVFPGLVLGSTNPITAALA